MQKALLSAAVALILVLVTALAGPLFVDWGRYRETFETEIARLTGSDVRIRGSIDVRLLPVPTLSLQQIAMGGPNGPVRVQAAALRIELALGRLMHGEFVASDVALESPEISLEFGGSARPERPTPPIAFDPGAVSISQITVENGRLVLAGGPNGPLVLDGLEFSGEARSLLGPAKGEGSVQVDGKSYLFTIDAGRASAAGAARMRLRVDTVDHARRGDVDGTVWIEQGIPRLAGDLRWSQMAPHSAQGFSEPWRLSANIRADWAAAALEAIELQYGAEDRAVKFRGRAGLTFRTQPELDVTLAAGKIDLDRMLALPATLRRRPLAGVYAMADAIGETSLPPVHLNVGLSADAVALADATLERFSARLRGNGSTWDLDSLDLQAPGGTQVRLRGRLDRTAKGPAFDGEGQVETRDARPLVSWLTDGGGGDAFAAPFRAAGRVRFSGDGIAFDSFSASFDRDAVEGSLTYAVPGAGRSGRISATLSASMIDLDRAHELIQRVAGGASMAWPREGSLSLNVQRASVGGVETRGADISLRFSEQALTVERLMIDDFAGSRIAAAGSIDLRKMAPRGAITLDLELRAPDRVAALLENFSARAAVALRDAAGRLLPANMHAVFGGDAQAARAAGMPDGASFRIEGSAGAFGFDLSGVAELPTGDGSLPASIARLAPPKVSIDGRVDARDGRALVEAARLDRLLSVDGRAGRLDFKASGRPGGPIAATAQIRAGGLDASLNGTLQAAQGQLASADLALSVAQADVRVVQDGTLPAKFTARLNYDGSALGLDQIAGTIGGSGITGRVTIGPSPAMHVDGDIQLGAVDVPAVGAAVSAPAKRAGEWSAEPFAGGVLGQLRGRISLTSARGLLTPNLSARNLRGVLNFGPAAVALDDVEAELAGGRVFGRIAFERDGEELDVRSRVRLTNADVAALLPGDWPLASGRLDLDAELEGRGRSPAALIASVQGRSSFRIENGRLAKLDPAAFDAVVSSVDDGSPIEPARVRERVEAALARGALLVQGDGAITAAEGKARLTTARLRAEGADLAVSARYDLPSDALDARLTLVAPARAGTAAGIGRPEIAISLQGPIDSPRRTVDVAALSAWLSMHAAAENAKRLAAIPRSDDARPAASPPASPQTAPPIAPAGPAALPRQLPSPGGVKTEAVTAPPAVGQPEMPASPAPPANSNVVAAARPVLPADQPPAAAGTPGAADPPADLRMSELDRAIAANPRDGAALARRGEMFALRGNYGSAIKDFDEAIRLRPRDAEALNNRCWAHAIVGDLQSALTDCNAALQLRPRYADAFDSRGMTNLKSGQLSDAIADFNAALRINPKLASSLYGRGIARIKTDDVAGGNLDIVEAKALRPNIAEEFAGYGIR